jgi:hypothetical protein
MGQALAIRDDGFAVAERGGTNLIKGILTKFSDSVYRASKTEVVQQAPDGPAFVVVGIVTAWVTWKSGKPSHKVTHNGQIHPYREDLGDLDQSEWEIGIGGLPSDPHRDTRYVYLVNLRSGKTYTLVGDTIGMRQAVGELKDAIAIVRQARPGALPVVQLATTTMKTKYGMRPRPSFEIIDWRGDTPTADQFQQQVQQQLEQHVAGGNERSDAPFDDEIPY